MEDVLVSVIMPVYNGAPYIKMAIKSIINQTYRNIELMLIDDCGTDSSKEIIEKYAKEDERIRIFNNPQNMGIAYSRNVGLDNARGKYIAIMDDDDYVFEYRLEKQVRFLEENIAYAAVGGKAQWIDGEGKVIKPEIDVLTDSNYIQAMFLFFNIFNNSEVMCRRELIERYNIRYEDNLFGMEDFKFWIQVSKYGKITNIDELILQHRMTNNNETSRVMTEKLEARKRVFAELQRYSIELSGFVLTDEQFQLLGKVMQEDGSGSAESKEELFLLYNTLRDMILQARERKLDMTEVMEYWFRDLFADKVALISADNMWD